VEVGVRSAFGRWAWFIGVLLMVALWSAGAVGADVTASSGGVTATLSGSGDPGDPIETLETTLVVERPDAYARFVDLDGGASYLPSATDALEVRDLDGDGEPELIAALYSGGAHCCTRSAIAWWDAPNQAYRVHVRDWGDAYWTFEDLDGDGRPEFDSWDGRWAYWGGGYAISPFPLQVWAFRQGELVDVTATHPAAVARDAAVQWARFGTLRREGSDVRGTLAAYVADAYSLGTEDAAWKRAYRAYRLTGRDRYFAALRSKLASLGYRGARDPVPPVTRVRPEVPVVGCGPVGRRGIVARIRPGDCVVYDQGSGDAGYFSIRNLRWRSWGPAAATARAVSVGRQFETLRVIRTPVLVRFSGAGRGCDGRLWFTKARISFSSGGFYTADLAGCPGRN